MTRFHRLLAALVLAVAPAVFGAEALYPSVDRAKGDIESAVKEAKRAQKRVLVDFGGNWCTDCRILDINLKKPANAALLARHYVVVHVNVGDKGITDNFAVAERYGIPLKKGVPALAVLDSDGRLVHAQRNGEFESMRKMDPQSVNDFLSRWRGP